jgi:pimeloyl-ACP methyl ester carboxylesterase
MRHGWHRRFVRGLLVGVGLASLTGCLGFVHPVATPSAEVAQVCQGMPALARRHAYVFFVNGLDPVNLGNLTGLRDYVQGLGFPMTYYGQLYHTPWFAGELRRIRAQDPEARFVLVGFSLGSQMVRALAESAGKEEVSIDLMLCLSGNALLAAPADRPANVGRLILVTPGDGTAQGAEGAEEYHLADASYFSTPAHPETLHLLKEQLLAIASRVPIAVPSPPPLPVDPETAPMPRPVSPAAGGSAANQEWDFLRPAANLSPVPRIGI